MSKFASNHCFVLSMIHKIKFKNLQKEYMVHQPKQIYFYINEANLAS